MSVLRNPDAHMRALRSRACVCVCVLEMRHRVGRSYNMDQDPYSQKHFIGGSTDPGSLIRLLWSIKFQSLKGKTYRGWAPILCCCISSTKHIQIHKISQQAMGLLSGVLKLSPWHVQSGGAERNAFLCGFIYLHITSGWGGARTISQRCVCMCVHMCVCGDKVDNHPDFIHHYVPSSLYSWQSPSDRTGAITFVYASVGMCQCVSRCLSGQ